MVKFIPFMVCAAFSIASSSTLPLHLEDHIQSLRCLEKAINRLPDSRSTYCQHELLYDLFGKTRLIYDRRGLVEKLWSSTTFFVWSYAEEQPGGAGALANRAARLERITRSTGQYEKDLANIHVGILKRLLGKVKILKVSFSPDWQILVRDSRVSRNLSLINYHLGELDNYCGSIGLPYKNLTSLALK